MLTAARISKAARRRLATLVSPDKVPLTPMPTWYPQQRACQIPELWFLFERFFGTREHGQFVEIGANDGVYVSNTWGLAVRGWQGLMAEPVADLAEACRANHANHSGISVVTTAVGIHGQREVELSVAGPLSTASQHTYNEYQHLDWVSTHAAPTSVKVPCTTLDELLRVHGVPLGFDLLVIDVEGFETEVMSAFDLDRWRPTMIIIELADAHPDLVSTASKDHEIARTISASGYEIAYKDSINTVFVTSECWASTLAKL